jgi:hypothetical protein
LSPATTIFLLASMVTAAVTFLIVGRMANQLKQVAPGERKTSILLGLPWIIREHSRLFPQSGPMLAFWLSVIFLGVWLSCVAFSLIRHF